MYIIGIRMDYFDIPRYHNFPCILNPIYSHSKPLLFHSSIFFILHYFQKVTYYFPILLHSHILILCVHFNIDFVTGLNSNINGATDWSCERHQRVKHLILLTCQSIIILHYFLFIWFINLFYLYLNFIYIWIPIPMFHSRLIYLYLNSNVFFDRIWILMFDSRLMRKELEWPN